MDLYFACEGHFMKDAQGKFYSLNAGFTTKLWKRYLSSFDRVYVFARVKYDETYIGNELLRADTSNVSFIELPEYVGPVQFMLVRRQIKRIISSNISFKRAYLCRLPGQIGTILIDALRQHKVPYSCEVVGDPWDVFGPDGVKHPLRPYFRYRGRYLLTKQVAAASSVLYVTQRSLQNRYPASKGIFTVGASDVLLSKETMASKPKLYKTKEVFEIISIGSLGQMYKSPDVVIKALAELKSHNIVCHLSWLGDGIYREKMEELARSLSVTDCITFCGNVPPKEVIIKLQHSDVFILVSRTEGLPRALVEAMGQGLPCIGSNVGGIPELLESSVIIPKGSATELASKIMYLIQNPDFYNKQAERNLLESKKYESSFLDEKRKAFYNEIKRIAMHS